MLGAILQMEIFLALLLLLLLLQQQLLFFALDDADRPRCDSNLVYMPNDRQAKEGTSLMAYFNLRGVRVIPKENARIRDMPKSELGDPERIAPLFLLDFVLTVL